MRYLVIVGSVALMSACATGGSGPGFGDVAPADAGGNGDGGSTSGSSGSSDSTGSSSGDSASSGGSTGGSTTGSSSGSSTSSSSSGSTSSSSGGGTTSSSGGTTIALPVTVSSVFIPSGYMGDGTTASSVDQLPQTLTDSQTCGGDRSPPAVGTCYTVTYTPVAGGAGWAGVYWQYPLNNWGSMPGAAIASGATKVSVWAKGAAGGEVVTFVAGGISSAGMPYQDDFKVSTPVTLTTSWTEYDIQLASYGQVLGGFAWSAAAPSGGATTVQFSIDSIQWH